MIKFKTHLTSVFILKSLPFRSRLYANDFGESRQNHFRLCGCQISNCARKGFLTARRMVPNVHASKLPAKKSRNIARDSTPVRVVNKHGRLGKLKKCSVPLLFSMKALVIEEEIKNLYPRISQKLSSSRTKLAEKGRKRIFQERKEEGKVGSPASRKARQLRFVGHLLFSRTFKWKLLSIWIC